ncbi:MAG: hypothetical protein ACFFC7_19990 [Candidatus Hermodarchaeota archaeon]
MKLEAIQFHSALRKIVHIRSSGVKEIKITKKKYEEQYSELLAYIEQYTTETGFEPFGLEGNTIFLIKR